jgi:hypothetical protein
MRGRWVISSTEQRLRARFGLAGPAATHQGTARPWQPVLAADMDDIQ